MTEIYYALRVVEGPSEEVRQRFGVPTWQPGWWTRLEHRTFGGYLATVTTFTSTTLYSSVFEARDAARQYCPSWARVEVVPVEVGKALPVTETRRQTQYARRLATRLGAEAAASHRTYDDPRAARVESAIDELVEALKATGDPMFGPVNAAAVRWLREALQPLGLDVKTVDVPKTYGKGWKAEWTSSFICLQRSNLHISLSRADAPTHYTALLHETLVDGNTRLVKEVDVRRASDEEMIQEALRLLDPDEGSNP